MAIVLSYEDLARIKTLKCEGWNPDMNNLMIVDWTAKDLKQARMGLGLTMKEVGQILDVAPQTVQRWESGVNNNPMVLRMYGIFLERY